MLFLLEGKGMAGHYYRVEVFAPFDLVFKTLAKNFGNIYANVFESKDGRIGIISGEEYFLRIDSDVAITIIVREKDEKTTIVESFSYAGGAGLMRISWGAHKDYAQRVINFLYFKMKIKVKIINDIDYFDVNKLPQDIKEKVSQYI